MQRDLARRRSVVLVTGMSGTGKSSALDGLAERGHRVVDTDDPGWIVQREAPGGTEPLWDLAKVGALLDDHSAGWLFVSGCVTNQGALYDRFDAVVLLSAPVDLLLKRVTDRPNPFGATSTERAKIADDTAVYEPLLRAGADHEIIATASIAEVVAALEAIASASVAANSVGGRGSAGVNKRAGTPRGGRLSPRRATLGALLTLTRGQIASFRRRTGGLDERASRGPKSFRQAAWAGLQDSMPRAGVLSLHARVEGVTAAVLDDASLVQVWGPRYSVYVTAAEDLALFTLGRWPDSEKGRDRARRMAARLAAHLDGRRVAYDDVGEAVGVEPNALKYAATTGTVLIRWDGARAPLVWTEPAPEVDVAAVRAELARRYLHVFGPGTSLGFAKWAGISDRSAASTFTSLSDELLTVRTGIGDASILASDEQLMRAEPGAVAPARLLPSGDAYYLLWGADRQLLVPDAAAQAELWTSRVWPGVVLLDGEMAGTWRRASEIVNVHLWQRPTRARREAVEVEAATLPIPGCEGRIQVIWE